MATCGYCKATSVTVAHVRACAGLTPPQEDAVAFSDKPQAPTFRVGKPLDTEKKGPVPDEERVYLNVPFANKDEAKKGFGAQWDSALRKWFVGKDANFNNMPPEWLEPLEAEIELEDGIYLLRDGKTKGGIFMVYHTQQDIQVCKELIIDEEKTITGAVSHAEDPDAFFFNAGDPIGEWEYVGKAPLSRLTPENKLNEEDAARFGQVYGWCGKCGRVLRNEDSKKAGIGPVCAGKE